MKKLLLIFTFLLWLPAHANNAEFNRADEAYQSGDYATAFPIYKKFAEQGHAEAQYNLGVAYYEGKGVSQNYGEALKWYSKSAEQGFSHAQYNLGIMYYKGEGIPKNYEEALRWYRKAAKRRNAGAQFALGVMYYGGEGVPKNYIKAYMWLNLAIVNGSEEAKNGIKFLEQKMDSASITEAQKLASQCFQSNYQNCGE